MTLHTSHTLFFCIIFIIKPNKLYHSTELQITQIEYRTVIVVWISMHTLLWYCGGDGKLEQ